MTGSWIGRSLLAVPVLVAAVGVGMVVAGLSGRVDVALAVTATVLAAGISRVAVTGVLVDLERRELRVRTFWRTHRLPVDELRRIEARHRADGGPDFVRFLLTDGRVHSTAALAYLAAQASERFLDDLRRLGQGGAVEVALTTDSFRRLA